MTLTETLFKDNEELYNAKTKYTQTNMSKIESTNTILNYIYISLVGVVLYKLYVHQSTNKPFRYLIVLCAIIFPFIIYPIEKQLYNIIVYLDAFIRGIPLNTQHTPFR